MNITLIIAAVSAVLSGAAGFALAWQLQAGNITEKELDHANTRIEIARANRVTLERAAQAIAVAQADATARRVVLRRESDASRAAADRLRESSTAAVRAAHADAATCRRVVDAYSVIHAESSEFIQEVADAAGRCFSEIKLMQDAWPK